MGHSGRVDDYRIEVSATPPHNQWFVTSARGVMMTGTSPSPVSAHRCGAMALGALRALDRIGRRRF